jgi:hypothetical protein
MQRLDRREGLTMRGQWDHEQPLSPSLVRSALSLLGGFLAALSLVILAQGIVNLAANNWFAAIIQFTAGIAFPFAVWLGLRMLADLLMVAHRTHDKLEVLAEKPGAAQTAPRTPPQSPGARRAGDDGPVYPDA